MKCVFYSLRAAESPATFETPLRDMPSEHSSFSTPAASMTRQQTSNDAASVCSSQRSKKNPSEGHTLDSFLSSHTSEDNCSFQELIETADKKLRQKFAVLYQAEEDTALAVARNLCLPHIEDQFQEICGSKAVGLLIGIWPPEYVEKNMYKTWFSFTSRLICGNIKTKTA